MPLLKHHAFIKSCVENLRDHVELAHNDGYISDEDYRNFITDIFYLDEKHKTPKTILKDVEKLSVILFEKLYNA